MKILIFISLMILESCGNEQHKIQQDVQQDRDPKIDWLHVFYKIYSQAIEDYPPSSKEVISIREKYLSKEVINRMKELDYDPIINAQDFDITNLQTLEIDSRQGIDNGYEVSYTDSFTSKKIIIWLFVESSGSSYKITKVTPGHTFR